MLTMIMSLITSVMLIGVMFAIVSIKNKLDDDEQISVKSAFGDKGLEMLIGCIVLMWIIPYGLIIIIPSALILSILSPAGRNSWRDYGKIRAYTIASMLLIVLLSGFTPTSSPKSPEVWGDPLFSENPNAPIYPAGQQYTWLNLPADGGLNVEIIQSLTIRTPHQFGKLSAASSTLAIADLFDMQQARLDQAIQLLDQQIVFDIDEDEIKLLPIKDKQRHTYDTGSKSFDLDIRMYELRSLTLNSDPNGFKVGEVFCAASPSWGGELDILVVVRPVGHTGLSSDRYVEGLTAQWISS